MPCQTPWRDDSAQVLLFKIASCIEAGGGGGGVAGVASFNGRTGVVTLTSGDVTTALGFTPLSTAAGDARYVLKAGDTMTGSLNIANSAILVASDPALDITQTWNNAAVTFTGLNSNITNTASSTNSNLFNFQVDGVDRFNFTPGGSFRVVRQDASDSGMNLFLRKRGNAGSATGAVANDSTIGTVNYSGWDGAAFATGSRISGLASEAWTGIAHGSRIDIYATPVGSVAESLIFRISETGVNVTAGLAYQYNAVNVIRAQTALNNYFFGPSGNLTMTGILNNATGLEALASNTTGEFNDAYGYRALFSNTDGFRNVAMGFQALTNNLGGDFNTAFGFQALLGNTSGSGNSANGTAALISNTTGSFNTSFGNASLPNVTTGSQNTAVGYSTGGGITTGSFNTIIGASVGGLAAALSNNIILADGAGVIRLQINSSGNTTLAGTVQTAAGTAALPAFSFTADPNTGLYNIGADSIGTSTGGTLRITTNTTDLLLATAFRLAMASGANQRAGNAVLVGGTVTVANTSVTANTVVMLTRKTAGGTLGTAITYTVTAATDFTITSDSALDTSTFSYLLIEVP